MCKAAARRDTKVFQQRVANQVWRRIERIAKTEVDVGFAVVDGLELRMAVGHVQKRHISKRRRVIEAGLRCRGIHVGVARQSHARDRRSTQDLQEFALGQIHKSAINDMKEKKQARTSAGLLPGLTG